MAERHHKTVLSIHIHVSACFDAYYSVLRIWIITRLLKSSQQKQTMQDCLVLAVQLDSSLNDMYLSVCGKNYKLLLWVMLLVFAIQLQ